VNSVPSGTPAPGLDHEAALLGVLLQRPELALRLPTRAEPARRTASAVSTVDAHGPGATPPPSSRPACVRVVGDQLHQPNPDRIELDTLHRPSLATRVDASPLPCAKARGPSRCVGQARPEPGRREVVQVRRPGTNDLAHFLVV